MKEKLQSIDNKWLRLVVLAVVFINTAGMVLGYQLLPFDNEQITSGLTIGALFLSEIWNHWKNNSYTESAQIADRILKDDKENKKSRFK
ncbi:phage holin [Oceanobacillus oncorhynchi]|uniref:phage holin n=1 Tax=Oceanobacillus oncorhynchi TaxID=545501 RepID=UPI00186914F8|nr:phage holin [Oceanobacillus oncorhynchi]